MNDQIILQVRNGSYMVRNNRNCNFISIYKPMLGGHEYFMKEIVLKAQIGGKNE